MSPARMYSFDCSTAVVRELTPQRLIGGDEAFARETGDEVGFGQARRIEHLRIARPRTAQAECEFIEPPLRARPRPRLARIGMHDQVQPALQIVEHGELFAQHQQHVRRADRVGFVVARELRFDVADRVETPVADQTAGERRQIGELRHLERFADRIERGERIGQFALFENFAVLRDRQTMPAQGVGGFRRQTDDRVTAPVLAASNR